MTIDAILGLFDRFGSRRYGEDVTQLGHALQCAELAREDGASNALIAAALLHDIGQFLNGAGDAAERDARDGGMKPAAPAFLASIFPDKVTEPIRLHVEAKRYLCAVEPGYAESLSGASALSLGLQGGPMSPEERRTFKQEPHWQDAVRLRRYDDAGKRRGWAPPPLESYRSLLAGLTKAPAETH